MPRQFIAGAKRGRQPLGCRPVRHRNYCFGTGGCGAFSPEPPGAPGGGPPQPGPRGPRMPGPRPIGGRICFSCSICSAVRICSSFALVSASRSATCFCCSAVRLSCCTARGGIRWNPPGPPGPPGGGPPGPRPKPGAGPPAGGGASCCWAIADHADSPSASASINADLFIFAFRLLFTSPVIDCGSVKVLCAPGAKIVKEV